MWSINEIADSYRTFGLRILPTEDLGQRGSGMGETQLAKLGGQMLLEGLLYLNEKMTSSPD
jgi:hypothetical protein